ncbi:MAG: aldo/keto reductase [Lachnospiraceae bacterium]|nr:aldo/keto reductase [Lachnospiraceae bacterium]
MLYKHFTNANVDVSALAIGTWGTGELESYGYVEKEDGKITTKGIMKAREKAVEAIQAGLQGGVNLIDTAPCYGWGASERVVGEAIQDFDRDKVLISTKFSLVPDMGRPESRSGGGGSYKNVMREVSASLRLLRTDYIDFYIQHYPDPFTDVAETMSALNVLKKRGVIRYIGLSNHSKEQIERAMEWAQIDIIQPPFSMVDREMEELMRWAKSKGIDSMTYGSLGSGLLTGAIRQKPEWDPRDIRGGFYRQLYKEENFEKFLKLLEIMDNIAAKHNCPVAQVAINWTGEQEFVGTALCGVATREQAEENVKAFDWTLSGEEKHALDEVLLTLGIGDIKLFDRH